VTSGEESEYQTRKIRRRVHRIPAVRKKKAKNEAPSPSPHLRKAIRSISCVSDHPNGFEWCVNAAVVDANGAVYANSEDGNLYVIGQGGVLQDKLFQHLALGAAYTPASLDASGRIYSQNDGVLFVAGK
jgi:hypothetical protein